MSSIVLTLTNGIQEISAILPLLGTEQCEEQVGIALNNGFLYAAITPISLFGSLGIVKAGFNTLLAGISIERYQILGATLLEYMGFHPKGAVSESIALNKDHESRARFVVESQLEKLLEDEHIDDIEALRLEAAPGCFRWNVFMVLFTAILPSVFGITPYLFLIVQSAKTGVSFGGFPVWIFPTVRIGFNVLCVVTIQFITQIRVLTIVKMRLIFNIVDRFAKKRNYPISKHVRPWNAKIASEKCIWALQAHLKRGAETGKSQHQDIEKGSDHVDNGDDRHARNDLDALLKKQIIRHFPKSSLFTWIYNTPWVNISLFLALLISIPGSVVGYIGCFNVISGANNLPSHGPILWLGLEGALCLVRILIWALNPIWDDCGGISFCMQLLEKSPLVTCSLYGDELEKLDTVPVMREDDFLREVSAYSGPLPSFDHKGTALYYIFTGSDSSSVTGKSLYVVVSNYKENTSKIFVRNAVPAGTKGLKPDFCLYVADLVPDPRSYYASVSVKFRPESGKVNKMPHHHEADALQHVAQVADLEFMKKFEKYYDDILYRMEPKKPDPTAPEKRWKFRRGWSVVKMEEWGSATVLTDVPTSSFWKNIQIWRHHDSKPKKGNRISPSLTIEDRAYMNFGDKERTARSFYNELEEWTQRYLEVINEGFRVSMYVKKIASTGRLGSNRKLLMMLDAYEEIEVEFLIIEARKQAELLILRQLPPWRTFLNMEQKNMSNMVVDGFFTEKSQYWKEKLASRLSNEWKVSQKRLFELRVGRMIERLDEQSKLAHMRIKEQKYGEVAATSLLKPWERRLSLFGDGGEPLEDSHYVMETDLKKYIESVIGRFAARQEAFRVEEDAEKTQSTADDERLLLDQLFQIVKGNIIHKGRLLFSMLEGQSNHFKYALHRALDTRWDQTRRGVKEHLGGPSEMQEKLQLIQNHQFVEITPTAFKVLGASAVNICRALSHTRGISAVDFLASTQDIHDAGDFEEIWKTIRDIKSITGVFMPKYSDHPEISDAVKANVNEIAQTEDVCFYEYLRVADHYRVGKPYLYFDTPRSSTCTVKFRVNTKKDHILTLRHCFKGWWGENGKIEVKLNGRKLDQTWGSAPTRDDFGDEDILLPKEMLRWGSDMNEFVIKLRSGSYHLSDVFLPALPKLETAD